MESTNLKVTLLVDQSTQEVYNAINNVRGWWSENIEGETAKLNSDFLYHYKDVHSCKIRVKELIPNKQIVWEVLENQFSFIKNPKEWVGNDLVFEISSEGDQTQIRFSQIGLTPADECYDVCHDAWTGFITNSLRKLISTGKGEPTPKDTEWSFNEELIEKWNLTERAKQQNFSFDFVSAKPAGEIFDLLLDIDKWWSGLYAETIKGESHQLNDAFTFNAGGGAHYSKQKLIELIPNKKVVWLVTDSNLSFLSDTQEWVGTKISFELSQVDEQTKVTFRHEGLTPKLECYGSCSSAWTGYLENLEKKVN